ncbi:MAG: hypothetical protein ACRC9V_06000 [Aeromonas sp.]
MANPFDQFDTPVAPVTGGNPFDQFDTTRQDLQASGVVKPQQMPDLSAEELARLPDNPAEFAQTLRQPNAKWVQRQYDLKEAQERGGLTTFGASIGKGVMNIARGLGIADDATQREKERFAASEQQYPITTATGEVIGEAAPFAPLGVAAGAIPAFGARVVASGALGAAEGGIAALGRTGDAQRAGEAAGIGALLGSGIEAALPSLGRLGSAIFRRVSGRAPAGALFDTAGNPTPEMAEALQKAGVSLPDLQQAALDDLMKLPAGSSPEQAARVAQFAQEGIPYTKGDITQSLPQQAMEERLAESASDPLAQPVRSMRLDQSEKFRGALDEMVSKLGVPERTGESIKDALSGRKSLMSTEKRELYKSAMEQADQVGGVPVIPDNIRAALPDERTARRIDRLVPQQVAAFDDLLIEFGIKEAPEGYRGIVEPLSMANFEDFRQAINAIERTDQTGTIKVLSGPVKQALDDEIGFAVDAAGHAMPVDLLATLQKARGVTRDIKTEFSQQSMAGRLIDVKRDGVTPVIEASTVSRRLLGPAGTVEDMKRTIQSLAKSGDKGKQAIGDLQATAIMDIMEAGFGATSRKIDGVPTLGPAAFQKALKKIGDPKLNILFSNNKETLSRLKNLGKIAGNIQAQDGAIPKGSASVILDSLNKMGIMGISAKIPGAGLLLDVVDTAAKNAGTKQAVRQALNAKPDQLKMAIQIDRNYPALAQALGIAGLSQTTEE